MPPRRTRERRKAGGLGKVAQAAARQKGTKKWLKLNDGDVAVMRVLDGGEEFVDGYVHRVPMDVEDGKRSKTIFVDVPCLDQDEKGLPCPGCKDDIDRRYKFWTNVIVRDWEDEDTGETKDTLMIWSGGITVAKMLDKKDARHGIVNRDIEVEREGSGKNDTKYTVEWADERNVPLSEEDQELAKGKFDLSRYMTLPEYDDFFKLPSERNKDDDDSDVGERSVRRGSGFKSRKKDDDGDDDQPRQTSTRRSSSKSSSGFTPRRSTSGDGSTKNTVRRRRSR